MRELAGKVVLITGAASGIGRETALALAGERAELILCDVNEVGLRAVEAEINRISKCRLAEVVDVSKREQMSAFADCVHAECGALDILINNAGVGIGAGFFETTLDDWDWIVSINLWGVIHGLHYFAPPMVKRGAEGHIVNVSSMAGYWVVPGLTSYQCTKFGVFGLSEALREDLHGGKIGVSTICPGIIATNIVRTSRMRMPGGEAARKHIDAQYVKRNYGPDRVAAAIVDAIRNNGTIVPVSPEAWFAYYLERISPRLARWVAQRVMDQMQGALKKS